MKLSVLITYHNEGELLTECLESLFQQEDRPDEVLIYDDASSVPAEKFVKYFPVKIIRGEKNKGPAIGRNKLWQKRPGTMSISMMPMIGLIIIGARVCEGR